uniref:Ovule protein n=1 Tax=Romanomermis culicivorax TaxID=13658 RepID=A0A915KR00_ROMCU
MFYGISFQRMRFSTRNRRFKFFSDGFRPFSFVFYVKKFQNFGRWFCKSRQQRSSIDFPHNFRKLESKTGTLKFWRKSQAFTFDLNSIDC